MSDNPAGEPAQQSAGPQPPLIDGKYRLAELLDIPALTRIFEHYSAATGYAVGLIEHPTGNVLLECGGSRLCSELFNDCASTAECLRADAESASTAADSGIRIETCRYGLSRGVTPVVINDQHVAHLYVGQIFFAKPEKGKYKQLARKRGLDVDDCLAALKAIPVVDEQQFHSELQFLQGLARLIGEMGLTSLQVQRNEEHAYNLMRVNPIPQVVIQHNRIVFGNQAAVALMGGRKDTQFLDHAPADFIHPDDRERYAAYSQRQLEPNPQRERFELRLVALSGEVVWVELHVEIRQFRGERAAFAALIDIRERKKAEEAQRLTQDMLALVINNVPQFILWKDVNSVLVGCNENFARVTGLDNPAEIVGKTDFDLPWTEDEARKYRMDDQHVMVTGRPLLRIQERQTQLNGSTAWVETNKIPLRDAGGTIVGVLVTYEDITERKLAEEQLQATNTELAATNAQMLATVEQLHATNDALQAANEELNRANAELAHSRAELKQSEEQFRALIEHAPDGILILAPSGEIRFASPAILRILGYPPADLIGQSALDFLHPDDVEPSQAVFKILLADARVTQPLECRISGVDGDWRHLAATCHNQIDNPHINGIVINYRDVTESRAAECRLQEAQLRMAALLDSMPDVVFFETGGGREWVSDNVINLLGYSAEQFNADRTFFTSLIHPDERVALGEQINGWHKTGDKGVLIMEFRCRRADGSYVWLEDRMVRISGTGERPYMAGVLVDITERKKAEGAIRSSEQQYRATIDALSDTVHVVDEDLNIQLHNQALSELNRRFDLIPHVEGRNLKDIYKFLDAQVFDEYSQVFAHGRPLTSEERTTVDGQVVVTETRKVPIIKQGRVDRVVTVLRDITTRRQAEDALRRSETKYRLLYDNAQIGMFKTRVSDGLVLECNDRFAQILGFAGKEVVINNYAAVNHYVDQAQRREMIRQLKLHGAVTNFEAQLRLEDDVLIWVMFSATLSEDGTLLEGVLSDITDVKHAERALRASEEKYRSLVDNMSEGIVIVDTEERFTFANPAAEKLFGVRAGELLNYSLRDFIDAVGFRSVAEESRRRQYGESGSYEISITRPDGTKRDVRIVANPLADEAGEFAGSFGLIEDITERNRLVGQLIREQKEESMLTLAGGIAHDFNNILMGVLGSATLLKDISRGDSDTDELCGTIITASQRMVELTNKLLAYARGGRQQTQLVDLNEAIDDLLVMLKASLPAGITVELNLAEHLWPVEADPGQMHQVLLNLVINAVEAMPGGGKLILTTTNRRREKPWTCPMHKVHTAGDYIFLAIQDTGCGIEPGMLPRIFEPFFSTKFQGRGLGLAATNGIVASHKGCLHAHSAVGEGTTFHVHLPAQADQEIKKEPAPAPAAVARADETILFIDDEEIVRTTARRMLAHRGYTVILAANGIEGLELYQQHVDEIDLVIFDMSMPQMSGADFYRHLRDYSPDVKAIAVSGYSQAVALADLDAGGIGAFVQKPFAFEELLKKVRAVLDDEAGPLAE
ncbi:PAS domain S-box protein [bacterium]|nr:PAS domain S-box protein [bacterium]